MIKITLDDQSFHGEPALGTTLGDFLTGHGLPATEIVFNGEGRPLATAYTLVHSVNGQALSVKGVVEAAKGALTVDEIITATV